MLGKLKSAAGKVVDGVKSTADSVAEEFKSEEPKMVTITESEYQELLDIKWRYEELQK